MAKNQKLRVMGALIVGFIYVRLNWTSYGFLQDVSLGTKMIFNYGFGLFLAILVYLILCVKLVKYNQKIGLPVLLVTLGYMLIFCFDRTMNSCSKFNTVSLDADIKLGVYNHC